MKKTSIKKTGEYVYTETLENGLQIIMVPSDKVKNYYLTLNTKFGSIHTDFKYNGKNYKLPKGTAHFLEHLLFNMPDGTSAHDYFSKLGSSINAYTSYDITGYEVYSNNKFKENLSYLLKYVYTPYFTKELVASEKGIITEEIKMIGDNPASEIVYGMFRNIFIKDERQYLISGTVQDIKKMTADDLYLAYDAFYHPENMFLIITGNFKPEEAVAIAVDTLKDFEFPKYNKPILKEVNEPYKIQNKYLEKEMNVDKEKVTICLKIPKSNFKSLKLSDLELRLYINLIIRVNFGATSLLKEELLSGGIITNSISTFLTMTDEYIIQAIMTSTDYPDYFIKRIKETLNTLIISGDELNRKVNSSVSNLIMGFDEIEIVNGDIGEDIINYGKYITDIYSYYKDLNLETAEAVLQKMKKHLLAITILKPKEEQ
ncbi:MAG: pitrilysin family protein [Bacilli bacterium]|nr:pitrilysin family protein [Bacilli bacterium]MDD4795227.1 pitrilysin family protein [Bacilli bacterium]